jgi:hypothetical protein
LAHYDDESIVVYQAYRPAIAEYALEHGHFGGPAFSHSRMSWIKPNFMWMMYRSGWGTKEGQEYTLGIRVSRAFFDQLLAAAVASSFREGSSASQEQWKAALAGSEVRIQWDPDHDPGGGKLERRAIQLGLRGDTLRRYGREEAIEIIDLSDFVAEQRERRQGDTSPLMTPVERVYWPAAAPARANVRLDSPDED